jgi:MFS family permease
MDPRDIRNFSLNVSGEALWGLHAGLIGSSTVLAVFLKDLGAGEGMIGSILAIESGAILLPQVLGNYIFASRRKRKARLMIYHFAVILPLLCAMAALTWTRFLSPEALRWAMLGAFACFIGSIGVVVSAWWDWFAHLFGSGTRGTVMGVTWCAAAGAGACGAVAAGWTISAVGGLDAYSYLYVASAAAAILSIVLFCFIDDSAARDAEEPDDVNTAALIGHFRESLSDRNFRAFLVGRILGVCGFCVLPLVVIYYTSPQGGGLGKGQAVGYGAALTVGSAIANLVVGRLGDKAGFRVGLLFGVAAQIATLVVLLVSSGPVSCVIAYFGAGLCGGAAFISHNNMLFETCPHANRMAHITVGNLVISAASIAAPLLAGLAAGRWGVRTVFAACLAFSGPALLWFLFRVRDPRRNCGLRIDD